jgi:hypothetical protein
MKEAVYLIGQISVDTDESYEWRKNVRRCFGNNPNWEIIDPCNNGFNQAVLDNSGGDPERLKVYKTHGVELLVPKDRSYVRRSTMGFCNMNHYDKKKPIIGTMFELAWYYDNPEKTVIGIFNGDPKEDINCNHPFVRAAVDVWVKDEWEACELAMHYYQDVFDEEPTFEEARLLMERISKCGIGKVSNKE